MTLEFLLVLPVLLIVLLATVEFGMFFSNMQQVALASRVGAEAASQTSLPTSGVVPTSITEPIEHQLASSGIVPCKVILEHNVSAVTTLTWPAVSPCPCDPPSTPLPGVARYVRVTVCVPMTALAPNCLALFGFDLADCYAQSSTAFRYEL